MASAESIIAFDFYVSELEAATRAEEDWLASAKSTFGAELADFQDEEELWAMHEERTRMIHGLDPHAGGVALAHAPHKLAAYGQMLALREMLVLVTAEIVVDIGQRQPIGPSDRKEEALLLLLDGYVKLARKTSERVMAAVDRLRAPVDDDDQLRFLCVLDQFSHCGESHWVGERDDCGNGCHFKLGIRRTRR